jgi:hypothetical protein
MITWRGAEGVAPQRGNTSTIAVGIITSTG